MLSLYWVLCMLLGIDYVDSIAEWCGYLSSRLIKLVEGVVTVTFSLLYFLWGRRIRQIPSRTEFVAGLGCSCHASSFLLAIANLTMWMMSTEFLTVLGSWLSYLDVKNDHQCRWRSNASRLHLIDSSCNTYHDENQWWLVTESMYKRRWRRGLAPSWQWCWYTSERWLWPNTFTPGNLEQSWRCVSTSPPLVLQE